MNARQWNPIECSSFGEMHALWTWEVLQTLGIWCGSMASDSLTVYCFLKKIFIVIQLQLSAFFSPPLHPTPAKTTSLPHVHPPPWSCPCVLYSSSWKPLFPLSPSHNLLAIVRFFLISMSLVILCLLFSSVHYVSVKGEIIWYLSLTAWLISLSIMLSSSIYTVTKGRSSFFLSAA